MSWLTKLFDKHFGKSKTIIVGSNINKVGFDKTIYSESIEEILTDSAKAFNELEMSDYILTKVKNGEELNDNELKYLKLLRI